MSGRNISSTTPIANRIEVLNSLQQTQRHVTVDEAWELVRGLNARWRNARQIQLTADRTLKVTWKKAQSGSYGPLVMQVVT